MKKFLLVLVLSLFVVGSAFGFDGVRKGFVLGGGLGFGLSSYTVKLSDPFVSIESDRENRFSFMTDFKIGYAPTNQVEIVYSNKSAWFKGDGYVLNTLTFLHGLSTASVNYYLKPEGPTFFLSGGLGLASLSDPFENNPESWYGFGFYVGGGYEIIKHYAVVFDLMYGIPSDTQFGVEATYKGLTPRVTFVATAF